MDSKQFGNETTGLGKFHKFSDWKIQSVILRVGDAVAFDDRCISGRYQPEWKHSL